MAVVAAEVGLLPDQWWEMTPREFELHVKGFRNRMERELERLAWHAANIINAIPYFGKGRKKAVTIDQLLGRKREFTFTDADSFRKFMHERIEKGGDTE